MATPQDALDHMATLDAAKAKRGQQQDRERRAAAHRSRLGRR